MAAMDCSTPSTTQIIPLAEEHQVARAFTAEEESSVGRRSVSACAPATSIPLVFGGRVTDAVEDGGEMTNHRTDDPMLAALRAATSPTPPGGEMITKFPSADIRRFV
jgi:hypothetical protein